MILRRVGSSPLGVVLVAGGALGLWTCAYETVNGDPAATADDRVTTDGEEETALIVDPFAHADTTTVEVAAPQRAGPALRHPPVEGVLGLPIAFEDSDGRGLEAFRSALERAAAGRGQARILFYGASHVASDSFTGLVREELQRRYGDAGHGFVLPAQPWSRYMHRGVTVESSTRLWEAVRTRDDTTASDWVGLAGVAVETTRRAWGRVSTASTGDIGRQASLFEVYYLRQPGGGDFDVLIDGVRQERIRTSSPSRLAGYATYRVPDGPHRLELRSRGNGRVRVFGVSVERDQPGVVLDTLGINGSRARYHLLWEEALYREHLARRRPDLVVLAYGTNETGDTQPIESYEADVRRVVSRVRETVPNASCLLIGPSDRPLLDEAEDVYVERPRVVEVNETQRRIAGELGCAYFDLLAFMGGPMSMVRWVENDPPHGAQDHVHLTRAGYQRLGEELLAALLDGVTSPSAPATVAEAPVD